MLDPSLRAIVSASTATTWTPSLTCRAEIGACLRGPFRYRAWAPGSLLPAPHLDAALDKVLECSFLERSLELGEDGLPRLQQLDPDQRLQHWIPWDQIALDVVVERAGKLQLKPGLDLLLFAAEMVGVDCSRVQHKRHPFLASTPVGPPPTTTKVRSLRFSASLVVGEAASSNTSPMRRRILTASSVSCEGRTM